MFAITGFYHRYFSHRAFNTNRFWQFIFAVIGNSSVQRGPLWWAAHHRHHHRYADTEKDIHSPSRHGFIWSHIGWLTSPANFPTKMQFVKDWAKYPELRWINRFDTVIPVLLAVILFLGGNLLQKYTPGLGTNGPQLLIWGFFISSVLLFHGTVTINSFDHMIGSRRYDTPDTSRNNAILALITLGEGWHNNHHHYAISARQGFYWWEIDITYYQAPELAGYRPGSEGLAGRFARTKSGGCRNPLTKIRTPIYRVTIEEKFKCELLSSEPVLQAWWLHTCSVMSMNWSSMRQGIMSADTPTRLMSA
jgi:fatty-acid desaturase